MGDATPVSLPPGLEYPVTITRLLATPGQSVRRGDRLLEFSFLSATRRKDNAAAEAKGKVVPPTRRQDDMVGSFESPIDGTVSQWEEGVTVGLKIDRRQAIKPLIRIEQPCTHPVQIHGMCGVCGADLTSGDYLTAPAESREGPSRYPGSFELAHDALGVTVSTNEARRLETLSRDSLLESRRLSLIVDLDQTIIHTTVDPTVGEWMAEIEEDERLDKEAANDKAKATPGESTTPPSSPPPSLVREKNPNAEALQDVARFQLADDLPPGARPRQRGPEPVRWYYTKPRPGLTEFLDTMSKLYEMHVYTMGTRTYADAICKVIDPEGKIFGGRILSRDESGSMSSKSLMRLFPTDQSMVVVIDDRSDVWGDCPNLVKVVPYDFFGVGDINGTFLPPTQPTITPIPGQPAPNTPSAASSTPPPETPPEIPSTEEGLLLQSKLLDELAEKRPLAKLEEESDNEHDEECDEHKEEDKAGNKSSTSSDSESHEQAGPHPHNHHHHRKRLLNPDDYELDRVGGILRTIHTEYYNAYDHRDAQSSAMPLQCDTPLLIQEIKDQVLAGCVILFTGVIPRNQDPERSEIWQSAESFGAECVHNLSDNVTHVVTAALGTEKMRRAQRMPRVKIVWLAWLQSSIALWKREPEAPFLAIPGADGESAVPSRPETPKDADGDDRMQGDLASFSAAWDDAAMRELDEFLAERSDSDDDDENGNSSSDSAGSGSSGSSGGSQRHMWSRASTPGPSILARSRATTPSGTNKHVRYADDLNLPLESVREPQPDDIPSFPPRKKRKVLALVPPGPDDDVPESAKMVWKPHNAKAGSSSNSRVQRSDGNGYRVDADGDTDMEDGSGSGAESEDEFAAMLNQTLAE